MAVTATPIFPQTPNVGVMNAVLSTAMTNTSAFDGTQAVGTAMALIFTAGANGARVDGLKARLTSTNGAAAAGSSSATLVRYWLNNGSANTTATNNTLLCEIAVPASGVSALATTVVAEFFSPTSYSIPAGYKIYAGITVAPAGTNIGVLVSAFGGDF